MQQFCDVALPVPLDTVFTYRLDGAEPAIGSRVLVPFRNDRLAGVVVRLHDDPPAVEAKSVLAVLDSKPALDLGLMKLAEWISQYYLAPIGEVLRTMLPLKAEVRRIRQYAITSTGEKELHSSAQQGSSRRSKKSEEDQMTEYRVLDYLLNHGSARESTLRNATGATLELLKGMARKKWIAREDASTLRDARRLIKTAVLQPEPPSQAKLNQNQHALLEALRNAGGSLAVETLRRMPLPQSTLNTLVRRGLVAIAQQEAEPSLPAALAPAQLMVQAGSVERKAKSPLGFDFNADQATALNHIRDRVQQKTFSVTLLYGVTGSGKTAVYLAAMREVVAAGRTALMLVPEIGLTPAAAYDLHVVFGEQVAILHSALSADERAQQWHRIRSGAARVVVGTRSAVFAPLTDLALIVVDEEQDGSYKQEETPRYHGRDVAVMRGKLGAAAVVLGSATPSLESYYNAAKKYSLITLHERVEKRPLPEVETVDMRAEFQHKGSEQIFSRRLLEEVGERLALGEQAMILLNRRGYSAQVLCRKCGENVQCINCAIALTYHKEAHRLMCHYCGYMQPVPKICPHCRSEFIYFIGTGSEKVEERLRAAFPQARIARLDRDTVRGRHHFERVLAQLNSGAIDLLVGTQMIAKGHDIHGVTLVGVVGADFALGFPDFRAAERTFQLLTQVAGRAGRGEVPGKVILQTYFPDHYAIQFAAQHDYPGFYEKELRYRRWMHYPPFTVLATVLLRSDQLQLALQYAGLLGKWLQANPHEGVRVLGPAAAPIVRLKRDYRYHFVLKSTSRQKLNTLLRNLTAYALGEKLPRSNMIVDVDALSLL